MDDKWLEEMRAEFARCRAKDDRWRRATRRWLIVVAAIWFILMGWALGPWR